MSHDPEDAPVTIAKPEPGRIHSFRGKPLAPYSFHYEATIIRLGEGHRLPSFELASYLVYLLLTKNPAQADAIRSPEAISQFRLDAGEWAQREKVTSGDGWAELDALAQSILHPVDEARRIEPTPRKGGRKPGNG